MTESLLIRRARELREQIVSESLLLAKGGAADFADYRYKVGRIAALRETRRDLLDTIDPQTRASYGLENDEL